MKQCQDNNGIGCHKDLKQVEYIILFRIYNVLYNKHQGNGHQKEACYIFLIVFCEYFMKKKSQQYKLNNQIIMRKKQIIDPLVV